jgi:DNA-binding beta-propeller fold protein YncE
VLLISVIVPPALGQVAESVTSGEVGPSLHLTANGHLLRPAGRLTTVGDFPTGSAVVPGGRHLWVADCGHGEDDVRVVDLADGSVVQTLPLPGCYGGVAFPLTAVMRTSAEPRPGARRPRARRRAARAM